MLPLDIPCSKPERARHGRPKKIIANVVARTDHAHLPLFCFVLVVGTSDSEKYRAGRVVRPIPLDRFRLLGDEKGHFWQRTPHALPEVGHVVEIQFFEDAGQIVTSSKEVSLNFESILATVGNLPKQALIQDLE